MRDVGIGVLVALGVGGVFLVRPGLVASLDERVCDHLTASIGRSPPSGRVAIVEIDDKSLAQFGRWPWPRSLLAQLADRTFERGAGAVIFDMMFPEPDGTGDVALAKALVGKPVVVGYTLTFGGNRGAKQLCDIPPFPVTAVTSKQFSREPLFRASGAICTVATVSGAAKATGFLNAVPDRDGRLRRIPLLIESGGSYFPSLALAALAVARPPSAVQLITNGSGASQLLLDGMVIPLESLGSVRLRFRGPRRTFPYASAADVLEGSAPAQILRNRIVIVGGSALGLENTVSTPVDSVFPGVEVQATAIDNLLQADSFHRPPGGQLWELVLALAVGFASVLLLVAVRYLWASLLTVALAIAVWNGCGLLLSGTGVLISPLPATAAITCDFSILTLLGYLREKSRADRTRQQLDSTRTTAREAIEKSQQRFQRLVQNVNDAIVMHDVEGRLAFANTRFREWFGVTEAHIYNVKLEDWVAPEWRAAVRDSHNRRVRGESVPNHDEYEGIRPDGTKIWIEALTATVEENGKIVGTQAALRDITSRKQIEAQYLQAQKMESVGRLAGGVAHDFNNLLTVIYGYSEMLLAETGPEDPRREALEQIRVAGERAAELTQKLLAFSRKQLAEPRAVNPNAVVAEAQKMFGRLLGEDIELITRLAPGVGEIVIDPGQLQQVLMNLAVNSRDAMPNGGKLIIETRNETVDEALAVRHPGLATGSYVYVEVADTGTGMTPEVKQHLFEPFFTTKEIGRGTGLGLATVYGIVRQSNGWIGATSELGQGTAFHIYLPRVSSAVTAEPGVSVSEPVARGSETVLVVEDQDAVRGMIKTMLEGHGYHVLVASDGPAAIELAASHSGPVHLLLTDVVLPLMNGRMVADHLMAARPGIKVLFTSGHTEETIGHHGVLDSGLTYLPKPFTRDLLAAKVREALANSVESERL